MKNGAAAAPMLRMRDVVPAAVVVVLLLGIAGCMGALGGGPLDVTPVASGPTGESGAPEDDAPSVPAPAFVPADPAATAEPTPEWFGSYAEQLAESKRSGAAPEAFVTRKPLFSCGDFVLAPGATVPEVAWDCLTAGVEGGAELVIVRSTTEGDPIITYYRVGPGIDGVETFTDTSFDSFGSGDWERTTCAPGDAPDAGVLGDCPAAD